MPLTHEQVIRRGLSHKAMNVGDIAIDMESGIWYIYDWQGWKEF